MYMCGVSLTVSIVAMHTYNRSAANEASSAMSPWVTSYFDVLRFHRVSSYELCRAQCCYRSSVGLSVTPVTVETVHRVIDIGLL